MSSIDEIFSRFTASGLAGIAGIDPDLAHKIVSGDPLVVATAAALKSLGIRGQVPVKTMELHVSIAHIDSLVKNSYWRVGCGLLPWMTIPVLREYIREQNKTQSTHVIADHLTQNFIATATGKRVWHNRRISEYLKSKSAEEIDRDPDEEFLIEFRKYAISDAVSSLAEIGPMFPMCVEVEKDSISDRSIWFKSKPLPYAVADHIYEKLKQRLCVNPVYGKEAVDQ